MKPLPVLVVIVRKMLGGVRVQYTLCRERTPLSVRAGTRMPCGLPQRQSQPLGLSQTLGSHP